MNFAALDWAVLDRLRRTFLGGAFGRSGYWQGPHDLAQYDATFGERIGWKWDAVLAELAARGWRPPEGVTTLVDWGCGSGVAGRRVAAAFPQLARAVVSDHSPAAMRFAADRLRAEHPALQAVEVAPSALGSVRDGFVLVASHVWNELPTDARDALFGIASRADAVLWVEPGTHESGREVQAVRQRLLATHDVIAPCTHQGACGLLAPGREGDWCHHFASPPPGVFGDGDWARFAERAGIDLRALPYAFLVAERRTPGSPPRPDDRWERLLGRPRVFKPEARVHSCGRDGVSEVVVPKRTAPDLYRACKRDAVPVRVRWKRDAAGKVVGAETDTEAEADAVAGPEADPGADPGPATP